MAYRAVRCQIPELAHKVGLELQEVAELAEIVPTQLSDYISLRRIPGWEISKALAVALKCSIDDLYVSEFYQKRDRGIEHE